MFQTNIGNCHSIIFRRWINRKYFWGGEMANCLFVFTGNLISFSEVMGGLTSLSGITSNCDSFFQGFYIPFIHFLSLVLGLLISWRCFEESPFFVWLRHFLSHRKGGSLLPWILRFFSLPLSRETPSAAFSKAGSFRKVTEVFTVYLLRAFCFRAFCSSEYQRCSIPTSNERRCQGAQENTDELRLHFLEFWFQLPLLEMWMKEKMDSRWWMKTWKWWRLLMRRQSITKEVLMTWMQSPFGSFLNVISPLRMMDISPNFETKERKKG